ncbi:MAG: CPBP family intramembrane glutamic endopeptidase, partial [Acutalibacteraceae bacterium]
MKNLIVNIYKTLFFFDLAIVVAYYLPDLKTESTALLTLWREGVFLAVMIAFTLVFIKLVEKKRLKVFNFKNKLRHYSLGLITAIIPLGITVLSLWAVKSLSFNGVNKLSGIALWLAALLFNAVANELLLRGYLFKLYRKYYGLPTVTVIVTLLFISLNINIFSGGIIYTTNMLLNNILLCLLAEYSYSVLAPITAHFFYNVISGFVLGSLTVSKDYPVL